MVLLLVSFVKTAVEETIGNPFRRQLVGGGLIGYVKSKPLGNGQILSIDVLVIEMIIAVFHKKVDLICI